MLTMKPNIVPLIQSTCFDWNGNRGCALITDLASVDRVWVGAVVNHVPDRICIRSVETGIIKEFVKQARMHDADNDVTCWTYTSGPYTVTIYND